MFAQEGANVLLVDLNLAAAEKVQKTISERYPNVKSAAIKADVGKEDDVKGAVDKAVELFGRLDVMVCVMILYIFGGIGLIDRDIFSLTMPVCKRGLLVGFLGFKQLRRNYAPCR